MAVPVERQIERAANKREREHQRHLVTEWAERLERVRQYPGIERVESAEQRPAKQHEGAESELDETKALVRAAVVGGLGMTFRADLSGKVRRHGITQRAHVTDLSTREPSLYDAAADQQDQKYHRESGCAHM